MISNEIEFRKYAVRGAYHWEQISRSISRHNAFVSARYDAVLIELGDIQGLTILDIGGGDGVLSYLLTKQGAKTITVDPVLQALYFAQQAFKERGLQAHLAAVSAYTLPFPKDTFDAAICADVIEHVQSPHKLLAEAARVLRPGGRFVLTTPLRVSEKPFDRMHVHEFFESELKSLMAATFCQITTTTFIPLALQDLFRLPFPWLGGRPLFRYLFNAVSIYLGCNPFAIRTGFRYYSMIIATGEKCPI
jgi:2-polyprenyl-3-methyl-5-hydroxy-6-metoxy-1,4-benzoquinol methylase